MQSYLGFLIKGAQPLTKNSKKILKSFVVMRIFKTTALHHVGIYYSGPGTLRLKGMAEMLCGHRYREAALK